MKEKKEKHTLKLKKAMSPLSTVVDVSAGSELLTQGTYSREAILILSGEAEVTRDGEHVAIVKEGELIGELGLLSHDYIRNATVKTLTPCEIAVMSAPEFNALIATSPEFASLVDATLANRNA